MSWRKAICLPSGDCPTGTIQTEGIEDVILCNSSDLATIVDCNREILISSKSVQIANTSVALQDSKACGFPVRRSFFTASPEPMPLLGPPKVPRSKILIQISSSPAGDHGFALKQWRKGLLAADGDQQGNVRQANFW
jgi:hypothetical protein